MMEGGRLQGLDALRGIAALVVVGFHVTTLFDLGVKAPRGYLAVDFFFVLSGYVIARRIEGREDFRPLVFLASRYRRFWPVMFAGLAIGTFQKLCFPNPTVDLLPAVIAGALLLPTFSSPVIFPVNSPTWSIFFELWANAVHSVLPKRFWPAIFIASLTILLMNGHFVSASTPESFALGFPTVLMSYSLGVMLFYRWRDQPPVTLPAIFGSAMLVILLPISGGWFDFAFVLLICPVLIAIGLGPTPKWLAALGGLSFPLYAVHYPVLEFARPLGPLPATGLALITGAIVALFPKAWRWLKAIRSDTAQRARIT